MVLFQRWHRPAAPNRRRRPAHRLGALEHLERRLALSAAPAWVQNLFPKAEAATAIFAQDVFTESTTFETKASAVFGNEAPWQVFTNLPEGVTIQKWVEAKKPAWVDVTAFPQAFPVMDFTKQLALRAVKNSNTIKVTIDPTVVQGDVAALFKSFGKVRSLPLSDQAPVAVQDLAATATGVGELTVSWDPQATGAATSYTVTMTTMAGYGSSTQTQVTTNTSLAYTGLAPSNSYAFSVTASNASGTGIAAQASFGQSPILFPLGPSALTTGLDGSVWVTQDSGFIDGIDTGLVKDMLPGAVQQIVNNNGVWTAQPAIDVGVAPAALTTGLDGSIWVANLGSETIQQIVNVNGVWTAQPAIGLVGFPVALTTGRDGSIWVGNFMAAGPNQKGTVQQIVNESGIWTAQPAITVGVGLIPEPRSLTTALDGSIWVTTGISVVQIVENNGVWEVQPAIETLSGSTTQGYEGGSAHGLTAGLDGSIWVAIPGNAGQAVQQIVNEGGVWTLQPMIGVGQGPKRLTTGLDGSIWVANSDSATVQQIVSTNGAWIAQPAVGVGNGPIPITTGLDGSIWVANVNDFTVQQILVPPQSGPTNLAAVFGPAAGQMTLAWQPPPADGGSPAVSYTATVAQGDSFQTITTTSTSVVFDGLTLGSGTTYFTVTAANFAGVSATVSHQIDAAGNTIPPQPYTTSGLAIDGTPFPGGGFDGDGNAYSWEAMGSAASGGMRVGSTLAWNGVTFDLAGPNQPNVTWAAGQTIAVPQGGYTTLNLAGAGVNGSQTNQPITLTFTDGSSVVWTQSFSDWCSPQNYGHEAIVSTQSYRDTASGGTNQTTNLIYGYSYTIPVGKTLASITLPQNPNVRLLDIQMSTATAVNLSGAYTSWGIANGNTQVANHQGFDGGGYYYYSGNLQSTITWSGATFQFGPVPNSSNGQNNFVQAKGQSIDLPQGDYGWLYLAGAGANGNQQNQQFTLTFTDGSTATWTQSFSDWCGPQNYEGETIIQMQPNRVNQVGNVHSQTNYVYGYAYQIPADKTLASIKLPNNENVGILGMTMVGSTTQQSYAIGLATDGTPFFGGGFDSDGYAYSWDAMGDANAFLVTLASGNTAMLGGMRVGSTLAWNGVTFDLGSPNQPNFTWAAGQTIGVPQGDYNTLNLAGAAVNGSQQNQQITLTFTDGSSVVWTQSFSDWGSPQTYAHEATVSTQSYRNTASGGTDEFTNYIYGYSYAIPAGKTLASVTLPENPNVRLLDLQMSKSTPVDLSAAYNWWGIANGEHQTDNNQGFGGENTQAREGYYYYSGELGSTITWSGATFQFGPVPNSRDGQNNFVQAKGQTIDLPQGDYGWLYLAGASGSGSQQNQQFTLTFTDGSTDTWTQSFHPWLLSNGTGAVELYAGETIIQIQSKWVNEVGNVRSKWNYVFGYAYQIPAGKTLASITLPNQSYSYRVGILGMAML